MGYCAGSLRKLVLLLLLFYKSNWLLLACGLKVFLLFSEHRAWVYHTHRMCGLLLKMQRKQEHF